MASITTATGVGSGLPIEQLVSQIVSAERAPSATRLDNQQERLEEDISGLGKFKSAMSGLQDSLEGLADFNSFNAVSATSSDDTVATASASEETAAGSYDIQVDQLATAHRLASSAGEYGSSNDVVGTGELTFQFGTYNADKSSFTVNPDRASQTLTIDSSNNTLGEIRDTINNANMGVQASLVDDGNGPRLTLSSESTGSDQAIRLAVNDTGDGTLGDGSGLSRLAYTPDTGNSNLQETRTAQNAEAVVEGIDVTSSRNTLEGVIDGMSVDLQSTGSTTIDVSRDTEGVEETIQGFVDSYNEFMNTTNTLTQWSVDEENRGPLSGDSTVRMAVNDLQQMLVDRVEGVKGPYSTLTELGLSTNRDGTLTVDQARLDEALTNNPQNVAHLFAESGQTTDNQVSFSGALDGSQPGEYGISVTQEATRGSYGGGTVNDFTVDTDNDELILSVDGVTSGNISLTQKTYGSVNELAGELQSRINGDANLSDAGVEVSVSASGGGLQIRSNSYGSNSTVAIDAVDTDTAATLGLSTGTGTAGVDVAGTIGGEPATGDGQYLRAQNGAPEGIQVRVDGGGTGNRGTISYSLGVASSMDQLINRFAGDDGTIDTREDSLNRRLDNVEQSRADLNERMDRLAQRYRSQFASLDASIAEMQQTSSFVSNNLGGGGGIASLAGMNI
ncbi:flagellar hook-associated protein 2 [Thiohalospira halophila DSM 15071]|uniref:Flagellar hook-associated protein 2 n=1 Tax=Thiohalospira halophila DSM 15071 TaxID=1123397 RepID=A0A1I1WCD9_9GAMM|nr:flagellar filament capping protein FliD [Thiohalospira halophila]SFD92865.1 flagellar hook-associated protein 2 [Thiohalospira halophila DSM 15071]